MNLKVNNIDDNESDGSPISGWETSDPINFDTGLHEPDHASEDEDVNAESRKELNFESDSAKSDNVERASKRKKINKNTSSQSKNHIETKKPQNASQNENNCSQSTSRQSSLGARKTGKFLTRNHYILIIH